MNQPVFHGMSSRWVEWSLPTFHHLALRATQLSNLEASVTSHPKGTSRYHQERTWLQDGPYWAPMNGLWKGYNWDPFNLAQTHQFCQMMLWHDHPFFGGATVIAWLHEWNAPNQEICKHWPTDRTSKPWALDLRFGGKQKYARWKIKVAKILYSYCTKRWQYRKTWHH